MSQLPNNNKTPFRPTLAGCIARDGRLARAVGECYQCALYGIAAYLWRSMMSETQDRELSMLFDCIARDEIEQFRLLGELIAALGGVPTLYTQVRIDPAHYGQAMGAQFLSRLIREAIGDERQMIDRYQTLMGRTGDRVVRSILSQLLSDEHRHLERLQAVAEAL